MPRELIKSPDVDRRRSLGWLADAWMEHFVVHGPGDVQGQPVSHGDEFLGFIVDCYSLSKTGRLLHDSAFFSRPKGCDKSGLGARIALFEALGPCRFKGFAKGGEVYEDPWGLGFRYEYQAGEPMGRPIVTPYVRIMATEEGQTGNVFDSIYFNLNGASSIDDDGTPPLLSRIPGMKINLDLIVLPGGGRIMPSTASSAAKDGGKETFVVFDETHLYDKPELRRMYDVVTRNLRKRKRGAGTWYLETTTMFQPGAESVAEDTYKLAGFIREGQTRRARLLFDHRWGECEDLSAEDMLRAAILEAFGEAIEWNDIDGIVDEFYDTRKSTNDSRRYFLNAPTSSFDAWVEAYEWTARYDPSKILSPGDVIVLGFDGSRRRNRGVTDATALIGIRVHDRHVFELHVWEEPPGAAGKSWEVPVASVENEIAAAFETYDVVGFFADPAKWETYVAGWEAKYGPRLQVKASQSHPIEWWMTGGRAFNTVRALEEMHSAIVDGEMTHDGSTLLTKHVLNAREKHTKSGLQIGKEHPDSPNKIDGAVAMTIAWQACLLAVAKGLGKKKTAKRVKRVR